MQGWNFDARNVEPNQGGGAHPVGKFPATIVGTAIVENKDKNGGHAAIEYQTPAGTITQRLNLWNKSEQAVNIAHGQLSAICHATGIYNVKGDDELAALRGGKCVIEVVYQKGHAPGETDAKGYTEFKKVYDAAGNEPGKPVTQQQPQGSAQQPQGNNQPPAGWSGVTQPNPNSVPGWVPQGNAAPNSTPPWGSRG